jgi:hypothetical protein
MRMIPRIPRDAWEPYTVLGVRGQLARILGRSGLYQHQVFKATRANYTPGGAIITVELRYDDCCGNGPSP